MMDQRTVDSIVAASKKCSDPAISVEGYMLTLIISAIDALGYDPEELAFREGVVKALEIELDAREDSLIVPDLLSIMACPELCSRREGSRFAIATQTMGIEFSSDAYHDLDTILQAGFAGVSDCYAGLVETPHDLEELADSSKIIQLRRTSGVGALSPRFNYMLEEDPIWAALPELENSIKGVVVWDSLSANEIGYIGDVLMPYENSLPVFKRLSSVLELPDMMGAWLFDWGPAGSEDTLMIDCTALDVTKLFACSSQDELHDAGVSVKVTNYEVALNRNYCPAYYLSGDYLHASNMSLGSLTKKIQRGTTLSGKDLDVLGTIYKKDKSKEKSSSEFVSLSGFGGPVPLGLKSSTYIIYGDDLWYIDNACIQQDGTVIPKVISEIPNGQQRYTLYPEDGTCILIPRSGKAVVPFVAKVPTLISNNIFFIRLEVDKAESEYIDCLVRSSIFRSQVNAAPKPLSKEDVSSFVLPILSKKDQADVTAREKKISGKIVKLQKEIAMLEMLDPFDPLEATGIEAKRKAAIRKLKEDAND